MPCLTSLLEVWTIIVFLYKGNAAKDICHHHRRIITLLKAAGKVLARFLLHWLLEDICVRIIPETQSGFTFGRSTVDMIFSSRHIRRDVLSNMSQSTRFCRLNQSLWHGQQGWSVGIILAKICYPSTFVHMLQELHRNMKARVTFNGQLSDEVPTDSGV